jgi:hypothetical protein
MQAIASDEEIGQAKDSGVDVRLVVIYDRRPGVGVHHEQLRCRATMDSLHDRVSSKVISAKASLEAKLHGEGWTLPKHTTSFAPEGTWTNVDLDVTPLERRIWTPISFLGYWISDVVSELPIAHLVA